MRIIALIAFAVLLAVPAAAQQATSPAQAPARPRLSPSQRVLLLHGALDDLDRLGLECDGAELQVVALQHASEKLAKDADDLKKDRDAKAAENGELKKQAADAAAQIAALQAANADLKEKLRAASVTRALRSWSLRRRR